MKMNKSLIAATAAAVALIAAPAMAEDIQGYVNLGGSYIDVDGNADLGAMTVRVGGIYKSYFGLEAEASLGLFNDGPTGAELEMNQQGAIYAVAHLPINESVDLMARAGWGREQYEFAGVDGTISSFNYGVAAQFNFDDTQGVRADWTRHDLEDSTANSDYWSLSYVRRF